MVATRRPSTPIRHKKDSEPRPVDPLVLLEISRAVASTLDLKPLLELILEQLEILVPYAGASIDLNEDGMLRQVAVRRPRGPRPVPSDREFSFRLSVFDEMGTPLSDGAAQIIDDVHGRSREAAQYRSLFGGDLKGTPVEYVRSFIGLPLIARNRIVGTLTMSHDEPGYFSQQHIEMLSPIASQAALAIDNAQLFEHAQSRTREFSALLKVSQAVASTLDTRALMDTILDQLGSIIDHSGSSVLTFVDGGLEFVGARSVAGHERPVGVRLPLDEPTNLWEAIRSGEAVIIDDVRSDEPMAIDYRNIISAAGLSELPPFQVLRSWMAVPLTLKDQVTGMLTVSHVVPAYFKSEHARLARAFADQAALALENARLYEEMRSSARRFEALSRADSELFRSLDLDAVLQALVDVTVDVLGADKSIVTAWDVDARIMTLRASRNLGEPALAYIRSLFNRRTQSLDVPRVIVTEDVSRAEPHLVPIIELEGLRSLIEIPVVSRDGRPLGFFSVAYTTDHHFDEAEQRLLAALAERAAVAIGNAELHNRAQQVASLEERQRLARELHDSVSQALYGIALGARTARTLLDRAPPEAVEPIDYISSLAKAGLAEMRALIFELRPESLETEGLVAAITKQAAALQARYGLTVECLLDAEPQASLPVKEALYRITQEALNNIVKHAAATTASVALETNDGVAALTVRDNGAGFDPAGDFPGHLGLKSMRERAQNTGGTVSIVSSLGAGTLIRATFPLRLS